MAEASEIYIYIGRENEFKMADLRLKFKKISQISTEQQKDKMFRNSKNRELKLGSS